LIVTGFITAENSMHLRFITLNVHPESQVEAGVFTVAYRSQREAEMPYHERQRLGELLVWFNRNLKVPDRFSRSNRQNARSSAICWFKSEARVHINQMRELVSMLEEYGLATRVLKAARPGYVVYEDDFQVAAEPFAELRRYERKLT
jgi:hypothetical protein